jgi:Fe2+ or Zn2+ uptake regulation protein
MGGSLLLKAFGCTPKLRIMDIFLTNSYFDFTKEELARELAMSKQTLYKNFKDLEELGVVVTTRKIGRATLYRLDKSHPLVKQLHRMTFETSKRIAEEQDRKSAIPIAIRS